jgi:hypothetical protein
MGLGKKAKNKAKAVKGKTKKDAGKVKHKGKKTKNAAKRWPGSLSYITGQEVGRPGVQFPGATRPELKYEKGQPGTRADVAVDAPASAGNHSDVPIRASCPRVATEPDELRAAARAADTTAGRPESAILRRPYLRGDHDQWSCLDIHDARIAAAMRADRRVMG